MLQRWLYQPLKLQIYQIRTCWRQLMQPTAITISTKYLGGGFLIYMWHSLIGTGSEQKNPGSEHLCSMMTHFSSTRHLLCFCEASFINKVWQGHGQFDGWFMNAQRPPVGTCLNCTVKGDLFFFFFFLRALKGLTLGQGGIWLKQANNKNACFYEYLWNLGKAHCFYSVLRL